MDQVVKKVFEHIKINSKELPQIQRIELRRAYIDATHNYSKASFYDFIERSIISGALEKKDENLYLINKKFWGEIK